MRNPYEVLGVSTEASDEEIREAYRALARQFSFDAQDADSPVAQRRMQEINDAYDQIIMMRGSVGGASGKQSAYSATGARGVGYADIRQKIRSGRIEDAQVLLDGIPIAQRNAEWHFLKGSIHHRRGWLEQAQESYQTAVRMDPANREYQAAYNAMNNAGAGGYRTTRQRKKGDCDACDVCTGLVCADCCCECMGGDCIPCC